MTTDAPLVLPAPCPLCGCVLQRAQPGWGEGVTSHFGTVHPGIPAPPVAKQ